MLVTSKNIAETQKLLGFLHLRGVILPWSTDLRFIARVNDSGTLLGVVAYNAFVGCVCAMHCAGDGNWINREFLRAAFDYPFNKCGIVSIIVTIAADNARALKLDKHLGFKDLYVINRGWDDKTDLVVLQMTRENCRWIEHGGSSNDAQGVESHGGIHEVPR